MLSRIKPIGFSPEDGLNVLLYGQSGSGKTTIAGTFPGNILWAVCSGTDENPGELRSLDTPEYRDKVDAVTIRKSAELREVIAYCAEGGYSTFVLDHASGLAHLILQEILGLQKLPEQLGWGLATQQQYGQQIQQAKEYFRAALNLRCNTVIVAQERVFNSKDDGGTDMVRPTIGAALSPSLTGWLAPACDYVVQAYKTQRTETSEVKIGTKSVISTQKIKGVEYRLRTGPDELVQTKFRVPREYADRIPPSISDPNYDKILAVIRGEYAE